MARKTKPRTKETAATPTPTQAARIGEGAVDAPERGMSEVDHFLVEMAQEGEAAPAETAEESAAEALPDIHATYWTEFDLRCASCQITHYVPLCLFLNATESPHLVQRIVDGQFNFKRCPVCHKIEYVEHPYTYYDPERKLAVQVRPEWEWVAGGGEEWYEARLEDYFERWAEYDVRIDVVFGPQQLIERFLTPGEAVEATS